MKREKRAKTSILKMKSRKSVSTLRIQSQSMARVSALCSNAMKTPLTHESDDIQKSDRRHGYPYGLQCCLQLAQRLGLLYSVSDSPVKFVPDICSIGDKSGEGNGNGITSRFCAWRKSLQARAERALVLSCWKTVTLRSLQMKGTTLGSRTSITLQTSKCHQIYASEVSSSHRNIRKPTRAIYYDRILSIDTDLRLSILRVDVSARLSRFIAFVDGISFFATGQ